MKWRYLRLFLGLQILVVIAGFGVMGGKQGGLSKQKVVERVSKTPEVLASLGAGEYAILEYESSGCFQHTVFSMRYCSEPSPRLEVLKGGRVKLPKERAVEPTLGDLEGTVLLNREQLGRLDNLLRFYRRKRSDEDRDWTTTTSKLRVTVYRKGKRVFQETHAHADDSKWYLEDASPEDIEAERLLISPERVREAAWGKKGGEVMYPQPPREKTRLYQALQLLESGVP